jgi:hypothetical protein
VPAFSKVLIVGVTHGPKDLLFPPHFVVVLPGFADVSFHAQVRTLSIVERSFGGPNGPKTTKG